MGYDFEIKHRPGSANKHADACSRLQPSVNACDKSPYVPNEIRLSQRRDPQLLQLILFLEKKRAIYYGSACQPVRRKSK